MEAMIKEFIKIDSVVNFVLLKIKQNNGKIFFHNKEYIINENKKIKAFFKQPQFKGDFPEIHVCMKNQNTDEILLILLHEFSHYLQWKNNLPSWKSYVKKQNLHTIFKLESECEDYTRLIIEKEFSLFFDKKKFIQETNAYLSYYLFFMLTQVWFKVHPKNNKKILKEVSDKKVIRSLDEIELSDKLFNFYFKIIDK